MLTTKCFNKTGPDVNAGGANRRHVVQAVEASLRRLQTDRIDVLFLHRFDAVTPIDEMMRGLEDLVRSGKVIYPAVSNWSAWQTQRAVDIQERNDWARLQVIQPMYNLVKRQAEVELLPMAAANGIGVIPYSPAAAGLLSGKYFGQASGRLKTNKMYEARYGEEWAFETAEKYVALCQQKGLHPVSAAIAWVGAHPAITAPIIGARNLDQLKDSLASVKVDMTPELRAEIAALSRTMECTHAVAARANYLRPEIQEFHHEKTHARRGNRRRRPDRLQPAVQNRQRRNARQGSTRDPSIARDPRRKSAKGLNRRDDGA